jgi:hypothetical protein
LKAKPIQQGHWYIGPTFRVLASEPIDKNKNRQHDNEDFKKRVHAAVVDFGP